MLADWFQTSSFLCYNANPCRIPGTSDATPDSATHFGANVGLSVVLCLLGVWLGALLATAFER